MNNSIDNLEPSTDDLDIKIELHFLTDKGVTSHQLSYVIERVSQAIYDAEKDELSSIVDRFDGWPNVQFDAMRYRFEQRYRPSLFNIEYGGKGSLLLFGVAAGFAYWVADKTLGETVREAWIESDSHAKLKEFLKSRVFTKRGAIADSLRDRYHYRIEPIISVDELDNPPRIVVKIAPYNDERIPTPSEIAAERDARGV